MKPINIIIPVVTGLTSAVTAYFIGRHFGYKKITDDLNEAVLGDLNVIPNGPGEADIYLRMKNKDAIDILQKEKYVVFSVTIVEDENKKTKKSDA